VTGGAGHRAGNDAGAAVIEPALDHLVFATPDLAATVDWFIGATGVVPAEGGRHLGRGTRNLLVGLGRAEGTPAGRVGTSYLELIGPDREHPADPGGRPPFGIGTLHSPRLVTWAVHPADPDAAVAAAAQAGVHLHELRPMSRRTPSGVLLSWRLTAADPMPFEGVLPFVIDWGDTPHPATDPALPRVDLIGFTGTHPDPTATAAALAALGVHLPVAPGVAGLTAVLAGPGGRITLR
jgi:hypothetical protein